MASVRSLTPFHALGRFVADGEVLDASDPIVKGREALFETVAEAPKPRKARAAKKAAPIGVTPADPEIAAEG